MFSKPNALIYVRRSGLVIAGKGITVARWDFPAELITNLEVLNSSKFLTDAQKFFTEHGLHSKRALMVLDQSIVFEKTVDFDKSGNPEALMQAFVAAMPYKAGKRACISLASDKQLRLFATNVEIYDLLNQALHGAGVAKLIAITPASAYSLSSTQQSLGTAVEQFIKDSTICRSATFIKAVAS